MLPPMILLIGKLLLIACAFGLLIQALPQMSSALALCAVVTLGLVMWRHFKKPPAA